MRKFNFSSGPSMLPLPVLERAREAITSLGEYGIGPMELSHRSAQFGDILEKARHGLIDLLNIPETHEVLFITGGATLQFSMIPMNLLAPDSHADFVITGVWGKKAAALAAREGGVRIAYDSEDSAFSTIPSADELTFSDNATYIHYASNETIDGVEFKYDLDGGSIPVVCDASSNILSKPIDIEKYALIYAGAQKNVGPSGVTVVVIRKDLLAGAVRSLPPLLDYQKLAENNSMVNTPNTWGIYMIGLVCDWIKEAGGLPAMQVRNEEKAKLLYNAIDSSDGFYTGRAKPYARSLMNVTFSLPTPELDQEFAKTANENGMVGLAGHRSVGGLRASIYNAMPKEGVEILVGLMKDFASRKG